MSVTTSEFKKRFGKKPIDDEKPEDRFKKRFAQYKNKLGAAALRKEETAVDGLSELKTLKDNGEWHAAADLVEELARTLAVRPDKAAALRKRLKEQVELATVGGKRPMPVALQGEVNSIEKSIVEDAYVDAGNQLDDFEDTVKTHIERCETWDEEVMRAAGQLKELELRRDSEKKPPTMEESMAQMKLTLVRAALTKVDFATAEKEFADVEMNLDAVLTIPTAKSRKGLKELYEKQQAIAKPKVATWLKCLNNNDWASVATEINELKTDWEAAETAYDDEKYKIAWTELNKVIPKLGWLDAAAKGVYDKASEGINYMAVSGALRNDTAPDTNAIKSMDLKALNTANEQRGNATLCKNWIQAVEKLTPIRQDLVTLTQEIAQNPNPKPKVVGPSPKADDYEQLVARTDLTRKDLFAVLTAPDFDATAFRKQAGADKLLDDMVGDLGGKANSAEKKDFVKAAMKYRFGLTEITGGEGDKGLSTKALPRLYQLFAKLPASHTTDNEFITSLERQKAHDTSWHSSSDKKIVLKAGKKAGKEGGTFDDTTLHEIAHGVDMKCKFMATNGSARKYGGWKEETKASIKKVAAESLNFVSDFRKQNVPDELLDKYLDVALGGGNPESLQAQFSDGNDPTVADPKALSDHDAVQHAFTGQKDAKGDTDMQRDLIIASRKLIKERAPGKKALLAAIAEKVALGGQPLAVATEVLASVKFTGEAPTPEVWKQMSVHPAIDFAANVGLKNGSSGLWEQGDGGAQRCAVNGRVYQESYTDTWFSYLLAARGTKVSNYQFRHPMEWFAEVYSRYFLRTLAESHPLYSWLEEQEGKKKQNDGE